VVNAAIEANNTQKIKMVEKIEKAMGDLEGKTISILGLTFKPDTDDMREAPSLTIIPGLIKKGARIRVFCPQGFKESQWRLKEYEKSIDYCKDEYSAASGSDALVILTEWNQFRGMNIDKIRDMMKDRFLFDLRNIYSNDTNIRKLFKYHAVGLK